MSEVEQHKVLLICAAVLLLMALSAVWRSKTWREVLLGKGSLTFSDLATLFQDNGVGFRDCPDIATFPEVEIAKQLLSNDGSASVIYSRSQSPSGVVVETMDVWVRDKAGRILRYGDGKCVAHAPIGAHNPSLRPLPSLEAEHFAGAFGNRVRKLILEQCEPS